jgi:hypothetical protein
MSYNIIATHVPRRSQKRDSPPRRQHQPPNLHRLHQARPLPSRSAQGFAEECSGYTQHVRFSV